MIQSKIRWGIIGLGKMAHTFAADLKLSENAVLYGVASRNADKASAFRKQYGVQKHFNAYEELAMDPNIDIIYIATPHPFHYQNTLMCLKHGKAVLCEKPLGMNSMEVKSMIENAKSKQLFLMEGMWTRFIPATEKLIELLDRKVIGDILFMHADFGFKADLDPTGRLYNKELGGGSLLDIGIYPIYMSLLTLGFPKEIKAAARITDSGVDSYCGMLFDYNNSAKAFLESTFEADTPIETIIYGTLGKIKLHSRCHHSEKITIYRENIPAEVLSVPYSGNGYLHEIEEVNNCLANGKTESLKLKHEVSITLAEIIDKVKKQIGLIYNV